MTNLLIPYEKVNQFSHFDHLFAADQNVFKDLIPFNTSIEQIGESIKSKTDQNINRDLLSDMLTDQYKQNGIDKKEHLITLLKDKNTFTITTAHQPYLFGGPLYFVFKILSAVKLAAQCRKAYPDYNFIPVFYIGGEDHDLEESNHTRIFQKDVVWQTDQKGPVGRMMTDDLTSVIELAETILGNSSNAGALVQILKDAYKPGQTINSAITKFIHSLLADYDLLVINADDVRAKESFKQVIEEEITGRKAEALVHEQQEKLKSLGLKPQAFVRPVNFFYLSKYGRNRIEFKDNQYIIVDTNIVFSQEEMINEIKNYPERFSPNVIMRPLYQEFLLPDVAFVGGGGELAYWSDRNLLFQHYNVSYPVLVRRDSMMIIDKGSQKKLEKLQISYEDLFLSNHDLKAKYISGHSENEVDLKGEMQIIQDLIKNIQEKVVPIDPTLKGFVGSETAGFIKSLEIIEGKIKKAAAQKHETELNQLTNIQQKFFPNNGLQERSESFLGYYSQYGQEFFDKIYQASDPLSFTMKIVLLD